MKREQKEVKLRMILQDYHRRNNYELQQAVNDILALDALPPAEGAEAFVKRLGLNVDYVKGIDLFLNPKYTVIDLMREFASQPQPTVEGAEEFLKQNHISGADFVYTTGFRNMVDLMTEFATLHAQRLAEKMVEERLREELMTYDKFLSNTYWGISHITKREEAVNEYLKSRER